MSDNKIKLVLMSCCAPCSVGGIQQIARGDFPQISDFIVMFYNPNIFPESEYIKRLDEQIKYCGAHSIKYVMGDYNHEKWLTCVSGLENEPERGGRCAQCFKHRFKFAQIWARENGYNGIVSVFGVSKHKDQSQVDTCAADTLSDIKYLPLKFDENLRQEIGKKSDFYRQNYCGCEFSFRKV